MQERVQRRVKLTASREKACLNTRMGMRVRRSHAERALVLPPWIKSYTHECCRQERDGTVDLAKYLLASWKYIFLAG